MATPSTPTPSATAEMLLVSPVMSSGLPLSSSNSRKVTPSSEASLPKSIAVVTIPGAVSPTQNRVYRSSFANPLARGWPSSAQQAHVESRFPLYKQILPNPLFQGTLAQHRQAQPSARHITLPFDLRLDPGAINKPENRAMLGSIFPHNTGVGCDGWFVYLFQHPMPPKPWPLTIAGLPSFIAPCPGPPHIPRPDLRPAPITNKVVHQDYNGRGLKDWTPLFNLIKDHFKDIQISITEVMYWNRFVMIVLEQRNTDRSKLPRKVANIMCFYLYDDEMGRPSTPQARRLTDPTIGNPDETQYDTLRPGLRVTSAPLPSEPSMVLSTTTGVLLRNQAGYEFMTVASHGFPAECGTDVIHPLPTSGRNIGELIMEVSHTDVALVELRDGEKFSNVTFESTISQNPVHLKRLSPKDDCLMGDIVYLDSPDTGCIDSVAQVTAFQRVPCDDELEPEQDWAFTTWYYTGQDTAKDLPAGICGSAIWKDDGDVVGFFRYAPQYGAMKDWCAGIAAEELINRGFTLVDTEDGRA